ncbi:MAG: methyltransferase domain-containing protein [Cyanobacteria bacterium J06650_10]
MIGQFSETQTEKYYDAEDAIYQSIWDESGSVHWGVFDNSTGDDFLKACANLNHIMVKKGEINSDANVLDLGCGNGTTAIWLSGDQNCLVKGVDLSGVRIQNAKAARAKLSDTAQEKLSFQKASASALPFTDGTFTHVWSQAVIYHVPDKEQVLSEAYRVLSSGGIMVFDDLTKPQMDISSDAQKYVYERLLYDTPFSFASYQEALKEQGFEILEAQDLSQQLKMSYLNLAERMPTTGKHAEHYAWLKLAYQKTARAVDNQEVGWGLFVCRKP